MATALFEASSPDKYDWQDSDTLKLCHEISTKLDSLTDAINHLSAWRLEALEVGFIPANFLTELTVIAAAISRCKSQVRMPVGNLLRQIQSLLSGSSFPSKLEAELRGKIDLNRHTDQLRDQLAALEIQISSFKNRRSELVAAKWERLSLNLLAESHEAFSRTVHRDIVSYVKTLQGIVRALKQDAAMRSSAASSSSVLGPGAGNAAVSRAPASIASSKDADDWAKRDRRLLTRAAAVVKMERDLQIRERKLKMATLQLSDSRNSIAEEFAREKSRMDYEFEMRERALEQKLAEAKVARESIPPVPSAAASDLPEFYPEPGTVADPSSAIEAAAPVAPWAADQLETASRADDWAAAQRGTRRTTAANEPTQQVSTQQVLNMWSNHTTDASTSMYYSSDEEDSFLLDNNAAIQYVDRKQSLKMVREKAKQRSNHIVTAEQSLNDAEQQLKQASQLQIKSLDALAKLREARLAFMNDKIMEQKYMEVQEQLERLRIKEADLLEQQNVLNDSIAANETLQEQLEEQKKAQAIREQQIDEMDIDISRRMSQLKFRESEITRGMNELATKRKNFESDTLAERMSIEAEHERVKLEMEALSVEMSAEKRRQELLRLEQEHRQNIMKDFEESNRLQEVREQLAQKEIDFQKHVEEASALYTIQVRARMEQMEVDVQERMQDFGRQMEGKVQELAAREKILEGQERPIMLAKEMEDIIATCEAKVRRNDKETARLKAWEIKLQYQSKELDLLSDTISQQLGNDDMKKLYLGMQAQYKEKLARLALAEKKGGGGVSASSYKAEELAIIEDQIAVREKAVLIAEKNAAAIHSVSMTVKQAQAKAIRSGMGRRQQVISRDDGTGAASSDLDKLREEDHDDASSCALPPLDPSARPSVVFESALEDSKRKQASLNVSIPAIGAGSPMAQLQQPYSQKQHHALSMESAQNVVSALIQMGFSPHDQETFTSVLVEKVCSILRSSEAASKELSSKHFVGSYKAMEVDLLHTNKFQRERADLEARERLLAKREQLLLNQAKDISERSRMLALAENETKELRMKGLIAAEKLGRAHVQEVAAASSKLNMLADDVKGTNEALSALLCGVQALTDVENGNRLSRQIDQLDADMQQLDQNARDLEIRGNQHASNFMSLESPASPLVKGVSHASSADWRASPYAASLDDEEAALWDRLTLEQLEVLQGLYHTHSKALNVLMHQRRRAKRPDKSVGSESVDPAVISRVRALTGAVLHHNELARLSMKALERSTCASPTLSKVDVAIPSRARGSSKSDAVQIVSSNAFIPTGGGFLTSSSPVARRLVGSSNPDVEEIMGGSRRSAIRSVNFNASIREI